MSSLSRDVVQIVKPDALTTVLFCDVRGYTQLASGVTPLQLIGTLNAYFSVVVDTLRENHGTVAKFVGDAVFAYWLAEEHSDHAALACRFAAALPARLSASSSSMITHIGIHTGNAALVQFNLGNSRSPEPMGDAVNLAVRLEALCPQYNAKAIASEAVITGAGAQGWTALDSVQVKGRKGRNDPVNLYGLL